MRRRDDVAPPPPQRNRYRRRDVRRLPSLPPMQSRESDAGSSAASQLFPPLRTFVHPCRCSRRRSSFILFLPRLKPSLLCDGGEWGNFFGETVKERRRRDATGPLVTIRSPSDAAVRFYRSIRDSLLLRRMKKGRERKRPSPPPFQTDRQAGRHFTLNASGI